MQNLTTTEISQLIMLRGRIGRAHGQTERATTREQLDAYCNHLRALGRAADQVIATLYP